MLYPLNIKSTESTPEVVLDKDKNQFYIRGDILPEDSFYFFIPLLEWFKEYVTDPNEKTELELTLGIINSSSIRRFVTLFGILENIVDLNKEIIVTWLYLHDDEVIQYTAFEFSSAFKKLKFITKIK